jgi:hypothetical protein
MSLRFGLFLVEQGIISCDQFCGLLKVQQQSVPPISSIAVQQNILTIRQIAHVYQLMEQFSSTDFLNTAIKVGILNQPQIQKLRTAQQQAVPSLKQLIVDCELMTQPQLELLSRHFDKMEASPLALAATATAKPVAESSPSTPSTTGRHSQPPQPKFKTHNYVAQAQMSNY